MKIDLIQTGNWDVAGLALEQELSAFAGRRINKIRVYKGLNHALFEIAVSNNLLLSHKKAAGFVHGNTPFFKDLQQVLYKEGFSVQSINLKELIDPKFWVESLKKETNYVLHSSDHPLTGELFHSSRKLEQELNDKKIFSIRISHSDWFRDLKDSKFEVLPYSIHIFSVTPELAIAICGEKYKASSLIASHMYWDILKIKNETKEILDHSSEDSQLIQNFESQLPSGWKSLLGLQGKTARYFDRALIYNTEINSEAVLAELSRTLQFKINDPGFHMEIESANLCRWGGVNLYDQWWEDRPADEVLRGLLVLSPKALRNPSIYQALEKATGAIQL